MIMDISRFQRGVVGRMGVGLMLLKVSTSFRKTQALSVINYPAVCTSLKHLST